MLKRSFYILLMLILPLLFAAPTQAQDTDVITIGTLDLPTTLDPAMAETFMEWEVLSHLYVGLTRQIPDSNSYELALASSHEVSENGLVHTFVLRDDVQFNDGTPITADVFLRSIQRVMVLDEEGAGIMRGVVETVEAPDAQTLVFNLGVPVPYFEALVALPPFFAVHPDDFPTTRVNRDIESLIGNGLYVLDDWSPGEFISLLPNENYQLGEGARNDGVLLRNFVATEELRQAIINGEVDVAWQDVRLPEAIDTAESDASINLMVVPSTRQWYMYLSNARQYEQSTGDIALREVVLRTIDREAVVAQYFDGYLMAANSLVPELAGGAFAPIFESFEDTQEAVDMLLANDYSPNRPVPIFFTTSRQAYGDYYGGILSSLRVTLSPINRYVNILTNNSFIATEWVQNLPTLGFMAPIFAWTPVVAHPDAYLRPLMHSEAAIASTAEYAQTEIDVLLNQARASQDIEQQNELYRQAQELMRDSFTLVPLWQDSLHALYRSDVSGVVIEANFFLRYDFLEK